MYFNIAYKVCHDTENLKVLQRISGHFMFQNLLHKSFFPEIHSRPDFVNHLFYDIIWDAEKRNLIELKYCESARKLKEVEKGVTE